MNTPNALKGYLYPSVRMCRCPLFHACIASQKCQSYDQHNKMCTDCESRVDWDGKVPMGGHVPEGTIYPDIQDSVKLLREKMGAFGNPDGDSSTINGLDVEKKAMQQTKAQETLGHFSDLTEMTMEEKIEEALLDPDTARLLGKL